MENSRGSSALRIVNDVQPSLKIAEPAPVIPFLHKTPANNLRIGRAEKKALSVGVIGFGYWGPNIVRNFHLQEDSRVSIVCDRRPEALVKVAKAYPDMEVTSDVLQVLRSSDVDIVAVVTPVWTHYELAKAALENGKHVFVEKPFTSTSEQAMELIELAERKNLKIMVDHTFLFTGAVRKIKQLIDAGELGDLYYYDTMRVNLGLFQHDVNVIWDLAPHDLSIMDYLLCGRPEGVVATGQKHVNSVEDVAFITVYYPDKLIAHVNVNWLSPVKVRTTLVGGDKKMLMWNDLESDEKIKVYDRGVQINTREGVYEMLVGYRSGDMWSPQIETTEALKLELQYFNECIMQDKSPINDGKAGLRVVQVLQASDESLRNRGAQVSL